MTQPGDVTITTAQKSTMPKINLTLNGAATEASYEPGMHLLSVLRED